MFGSVEDDILVNFKITYTSQQRKFKGLVKMVYQGECHNQNDYLVFFKGKQEWLNVATPI